MRRTTSVASLILMFVCLFIALSAGRGMCTASAVFVTTDTTTQGNWKGVYGGEGWNVLNDTSSVSGIGRYIRP